MGLFDKFRRIKNVADASSLTWEALFAGGESKSGIHVNVDAALQVSTVLGCARVLAEDVAQMPLKLMRDDAGKKEAADEVNLYDVLYSRPNDWMTAFEFREMAMYHAILTGNFYAIINWRLDGKDVNELLPLLPGSVATEQDERWGIHYKVTLADGSQAAVAPENMFHLRGPSWNGVVGLDTLKCAQEAIGLAIATERAHASLHKNSSRPGGILSIEGELNKAAKLRLVESWHAAFGGGNNFKTAVLDRNAKWTPMMMSGVDAQHLETRKFQIEEICRALRVYPQMIGYTDKTATFASAEAFFLAHVTHSIQPWIVRWEQAILRRLVRHKDVYPKFFVQSLLRGDHEARGNFYQKGVLSGWLTRNEVRGLEDLNAIDGLDEPLVPVNTTTVAGMQKLIEQKGSVVEGKPDEETD